MTNMTTFIAIDLAYSGETGCVIKTDEKIDTILIKKLYNYENQTKTYDNILFLCQQINNFIPKETNEINIVIEISDFQGTVHYEFVAGMLINQLIVWLRNYENKITINIKRIHSNVWQKCTRGYRTTNNKANTWKETKTSIRLYRTRTTRHILIFSKQQSNKWQHYWCFLYDNSLRKI